MPELDDEAPKGDPDPTLPGANAGEPHGDPDPVLPLPGDEEKDDKGVPLKNRLAESERKREKAERGQEEERARREQAEQHAAVLAAAVPAPVERPTTPLSELMFSDPEKYQQAIEDRAAERARTITKWELSQNDLLKQTVSDFPELRDKNSEFFKETAIEYEAKRRYHGLTGTQQDAVLFRDAAGNVEVERTRASKRKAAESAPAAPTMDGGGGGGGRRSAPKRGELDDERRKVGRELGLTDEQTKDAYVNYQAEDANA